MRILLGGLLILGFCSYGQDSLLVNTNDSTHLPKDTLTVIGVGDIMMGTSFPENKLPPENGRLLLRDVDSVLRDADVTFGNLEGTLLDSGGVAKRCKDPKVCYAFRTPVRYVQNLVNAGFDLMSLANNHAGDMGDEGRISSMVTLEAAGILHAGQLNRKTTVLVRDGIRYGLAAFAPNSNCVSLNDLDGAGQQRRERLTPPTLSHHCQRSNTGPVIAAGTIHEPVPAGGGASKLHRRLDRLRAAVGVQRHFQRRGERRQRLAEIGHERRWRDVAVIQRRAFEECLQASQ